MTCFTFTCHLCKTFHFSYQFEINKPFFVDHYLNSCMLLFISKNQMIHDICARPHLNTSRYINSDRCLANSIHMINFLYNHEYMIICKRMAQHFITYICICNVVFWYRKNSVRLFVVLNKP